MRGVAALGLAALAACGPRGAGDAGPDAEAMIRTLADSSGGEVAVYYRALDGTDSLLVHPDVRMHAASTMKVPVMIQLFRDAEAGRLDLDDSLEVTTTFHSIVDGSAYELPEESDSDSTLYRRAGEEVPIRELIRLMITRSSNLATNLLIREADARRVTATMRELGADSIEVRRGVEDLPAFRAGLNNTTTARDLGVVFAALGAGRAASEASTRAMVEILQDQEFRSKIPAGVPPGTRVANKTGRITGISHDAALVFPEGAPPYVLVVLTRGFQDPGVADEVVARVSALVYRHHMARVGS